MNLAKLLLSIVGFIFLVGILSDMGANTAAFILLLVGGAGYVHLSSRLHLLEKEVHGGAYPSKPATPMHTVPQSPVGTMDNTETKMPIPLEPQQNKGYGFGPTTPALAASVAPMPPTVSVLSTEVPPANKTTNDEMEFKLGGRVFTGIGVFALILAAAFFFQYAFKNNWITEGMLVAMGIIVGLVLLGVGEFTGKKYVQYGRMLSGGGLGIVYISIFVGGPGVYDVYPAFAAFIGMGIVSAGGVMLAVRYAAFPLAAFALIGGIAAPLLLPTGIDNPHILFPYLIFLNLFALAIERRTLWRNLNIIAFFGTVILFAGWQAAHYGAGQFIVGEIYATVFFMLFFVMTLLPRFTRAAAYEARDGFLLVATALWYFATSYALIDVVAPEFHGLFAALLAIFYVLAAAVLGGKEGEEKTLSELFLGISFVLFAVAVWAQFEGIGVTVLWAAEALAFLFVGFRVNSSPLRILGQLIFGAAVFLFLTHDVALPHGDLPFLSERVGVALAILFFGGISYFLYARNHEHLSDREEAVVLPALLLFEGVAVFLAAGLAEARDFAPVMSTPVWALSALLLFFGGLHAKSSAVRFVAHGIFGIALARFLTVNLSASSIDTLLLNERIGVACALLFFGVIMLFVYRSYSNVAVASGDENTIAPTLLLLEMYGVLLLALTFESQQFFTDAITTVLWGVAGLLAAGLSLMMSERPLRFASYATLLVMTLWLFGRHGNIAGKITEYTPVLNERAFLFVFGAAMLVLLAMLLRTFRDRLTQDERTLMLPGALLGANLLLLYLVSNETLDYFNKKSALLYAEDNARNGFENAKRFALSVVWTLYSLGLLAIGIFTRSSGARMFSLGLLGIVILKVFLYDAANLPTLYRFFSFATLGVLLILAGYLYNRYRARISEFISVAGDHPSSVV